MKVLEIREFSLRPTVNRQKGFFKLPLELRQQIYEYSLIEPSLWDRRHLPSCYDSRRDTIHPDEPPFIDTIARHGYLSTDSGDGLHDTGCALRRGCLSLLRVNRQMHVEAAPIFWMNNVFCWPAGRSAWDKGPRAEYLAMIRHVSVLPYEWNWNRRRISLQPVNHIQRFWSDLRYCTHLQTLEVPAEYIPGLELFHRDPVIADLAPKKLKGKCVELSPGSTVFPGAEQQFFKHLTSLKLLRLCKEGVHNRDGNFQFIYIRAELSRDLAELDTKEKCDAAPGWMDKLGKTLGYRLGVVKAAMDGEPWDPQPEAIRSDYILRLYGMPLSPEQLAENNRALQAEADKAEEERQKKREHMKMLKLKAKAKQRARMRHVAYKGGRHAANLCNTEMMEDPAEWWEAWDVGDWEELPAARTELEEYRRMMEQAKELSLAEKLSLADDATLADDLRLAKELSLAEQMSLDPR